MCAVQEALRLAEALAPTLPPNGLVFIVGPTASGKSALALALAEKLAAEIVSADSRHVYRHMDIGTNKPTPEERTRVPHHLIDLCEPHESFSLGAYLELARQVIAEVQARSRVPLIVGGTGQYVRALLEGWHTPPVAPNPDVRARWEAFARAHGAAALFAELARRDPAAAQTLDPRNVRRVVRALEVIEVTGQPWSAWQRRAPLNQPLRYVYLNPPRPALYAKADARIEQMIAWGWLEEVRALLARLEAQGLTTEAALCLPAMSALGYREMAQVVLGKLTLDEARAAIRRATRRFIRAQDVWFRRDAQRVGESSVVIEALVI
ncbi:MAG: tRNA (adenosine(37)-N6)-dimethylallyltransferase MiaA [Thermoflexales bacterium]|nr:tRNA (adenosine(37)-N6)-dimethylallyltransferase MiaA [Thermoflexales bacterium]